MITLEILLLVIALFLAVLAAIAVSNLFYLRSISSYKPVSDTPCVSILVPARNEEETIGACVKSLLYQDYPNFEVIVMDDASTDETLSILKSLAAGSDRLKIASGTPLPEGWLGKHWACHQLSQLATGELLFFTDADTEHKPHMLKQGVAALIAEKADLVSALPKQIMVSLSEQLVMPFTYWSIMAILPLGIAYHSRFSLFSSATGQFMLFRRRAYDQIGGFASIKHHVVDDVELCKRIRTQGLCWRLLDGKDVYQVRQYKSFRELYEGHTKNLFAGFANNIPAFCLIWLWLLLIYCMPLAGLVWSLLAPAGPVMLWASAAGVFLLLLTWIIACARFRFPFYLVFLYPVTISLMIYMAAGSMFLNLSRKATWKGRYMPGTV